MELAEISDSRPKSGYAAPSSETIFGFVASLCFFPKRFVNPKWTVPTAMNPRISRRRENSSRLFSVKEARMNANVDTPVELKFDRVSFLRITAFAALSAIPLCTYAKEQAQFSTYDGPFSLGFSFSYPSSWNVTKKVIKTHLSEVIVSSKDEASTTAGLIVDSVKIDAIERFGTPQAVGQKVVDVEKKKDSVMDASVQSATAVTKDELTYYVIDYTVDSTRGQKRYIAKATVTGNQLYVFTAQAKVDSFQGETADILARMLDSFNVIKQYS